MRREIVMHDFETLGKFPAKSLRRLLTEVCLNLCTILVSQNQVDVILEIGLPLVLDSKIVHTIDRILVFGEL